MVGEDIRGTLSPGPPLTETQAQPTLCTSIAKRLLQNTAGVTVRGEAGWAGATLRQNARWSRVGGQETLGPRGHTHVSASSHGQDPSPPEARGVS